VAILIFYFLAVGKDNNRLTADYYKGDYMKTWKSCAFIGILAIIVFAFIACEDKNDPCNCDPKAHLGINENCKCGGKDCNNCTEQTATLDGITIRKQDGITVLQMNTAVANINTAYFGPDMTDGGRIKFKNKVTQINIVSGNGVILDGTVLKVGIGATVTAIEDYILINVAVL
jgi:hypothetical protein